MKLKGKKILITGGAGFIGANFVYTFLELGYHVSVLERKEANFWRIEKIRSKVRIYSPDLTNYAQIEKCIKKIRPDIVLHFATYGAYQKTQQDVTLTIDTNLKATVHLINACNAVGIECFINTGTSSEYGIKDKAIKETDALEPDNLYAITKSAAAMYGRMMAKKFGFPMVTIRPIAVYGYFEESQRLIPTIVMSHIKKNRLKLSKPGSVRDFLFIEDMIEAYMLAIKNIKNIKGEIFNIGTGKQHAIWQVVAIAQKISGFGITPEYNQLKTHQTEPAVWVANTSKAKKILAWRPRYTLEAGLRKNFAWFKENIYLYEKKGLQKNRG